MVRRLMFLVIVSMNRGVNVMICHPAASSLWLVPLVVSVMHSFCFRMSDLAVCSIAALPCHCVPYSKIRFMCSGWFGSLLAQKCPRPDGAHDGAPDSLQADTLEKFSVGKSEQASHRTSQHTRTFLSFLSLHPITHLRWGRWTRKAPLMGSDSGALRLVSRHRGFLIQGFVSPCLRRSSRKACHVGDQRVLEERAQEHAPRFPRACLRQGSDTARFRLVLAALECNL